MTSLNIMQQQIEANEHRLLMDPQQQDSSGDESSVMEPGEGLDAETQDGGRLLSSSRPGHAIGYWLGTTTHEPIYIDYDIGVYDYLDMGVDLSKKILMQESLVSGIEFRDQSWTHHSINYSHVRTLRSSALYHTNNYQ